MKGGTCVRFFERKAQGRGVISKTGRNQGNWNDSPLSFPNVEENRVLFFPFSSLSRAQCHAIKLSLILFLCFVFLLFRCCSATMIFDRDFSSQRPRYRAMCRSTILFRLVDLRCVLTNILMLIVFIKNWNCIKIHNNARLQLIW